MVNLTSIKAVVSYVISLDIILLATAKWLSAFNNHASNVLATLVSASAIVVTYYTVLHLIEKIKATKLDNELKQLEIKKFKRDLNNDNKDKSK